MTEHRPAVAAISPVQQSALDRPVVVPQFTPPQFSHLESQHTPADSIPERVKSPLVQVAVELASTAAFWTHGALSAPSHVTSAIRILLAQHLALLSTTPGILPQPSPPQPMPHSRGQHTSVSGSCTPVWPLSHTESAEAGSEGIQSDEREKGVSRKGRRGIS